MLKNDIFYVLIFRVGEVSGTFGVENDESNSLNSFNPSSSFAPAIPAVGSE